MPVPHTNASSYNVNITLKHRQEILRKAFERNVLAVTLLLLILLLTPPRSKAG